MSARGRMFAAARSAASEVASLAAKAVETGDYDFVSEARERLERGKQEVREAYQDGIERVAEGLNYHEDLVHDRSGFMDEMMDADRDCGEILSEAKDKIERATRSKNLSRRLGPPSTPIKYGPLW